MLLAIYRGKFEDLKPPRWIRSQKDPFTDMKHVQRGIGGGVNILIYENGEVKTEINGLIFPNAKFVEEALKKMELNVEFKEVEF